MSKPRQKVPSTEQPPPSVDEPADSLLETKTLDLDKQARSAAYRDVVERDKHWSSLNERIAVLQAKLDIREEDLRLAQPRIAELEQAERSSQGYGTIATIGGVGGPILLSCASFADDDWVKFGLLGAGVVAALMGLLANVLFGFLGWPKKQ